MQAMGDATLRASNGGRLAVTWLGHATVLIELDAARLITDPVLGSRVGPLRRIARPVERDATRDVDAILLSHLHADHADKRSLRVFAPTITVLAPAGAGRWLSSRGFREVHELRPGEQVDVAGVRVHAVHANHPPGRWRERSGVSPIGYVVRGSQSVYFAGDTDLFEDMAALAGSIDLALLPVGGWGPTLGPGHLDPARAAEAARLVAPRVAVPIHWGTLAAPWPLRARGTLAAPAQRFAELAARQAGDVEVRVLAPGESLQLSPVDARA
jgi:L-ascorbate metabolism protein UlaG (beta-lactamase superfamily)